MELLTFLFFLFTLAMFCWGISIVLAVFQFLGNNNWRLKFKREKQVLIEDLNRIFDLGLDLRMLFNLNINKYRARLFRGRMYFSALSVFSFLAGLFLFFVFSALFYTSLFLMLFAGFFAFIALIKLSQKRIEKKMAILEKEKNQISEIFGLTPREFRAWVNAGPLF